MIESSNVKDDFMHTVPWAGEGVGVRGRGKSSALAPFSTLAGWATSSSSTAAVASVWRTTSSSCNLTSSPKDCFNWQLGEAGGVVGLRLNGRFKISTRDWPLRLPSDVFPVLNTVVDCFHAHNNSQATFYYSTMIIQTIDHWTWRKSFKYFNNNNNNSII